MRTGNIMIFIALLVLFVFIPSCSKPQRISLWEIKCEACHDGKTALNGKVVIDKEQIKIKYKTLDEFVNACESSPQCMNILKHEKGLLREVGEEIGLRKISK